jgi:Flp pilus assembly protein TadG
MRCPSHSSGRCRRGAHLVECALVCPLLILLLAGTLVAGMGAYRYQQVASLAREGARWASVRGAQYQRDLNPYSLPTAATAQDIRNHIANQAVLLDTSPSALDVQVTWSTNNNQSHSLVGTNGSVILISNVVTVTITYNWVPEALFGGPITLKSTSTVPMSY